MNCAWLPVTGLLNIKITRASVGIPVTQLETQLSNPPAEWALLSLAEQQPLVSLRQKVQHLVDEDAVSAIESRFRQITDRQAQEQCIQKAPADSGRRK